MKPTLCTITGCPNNGRYCRLHQTIIVKVQAPIKKESEKKKVENREYNKEAAKFKKEHPVCMANLAGMCKKKTADVHHMAGRVGKNLMDKKTWLAVCRSCHDAIEKNPLFARQNGLSQSRLKRVEK